MVANGKACVLRGCSPLILAFVAALVLGADAVAADLEAVRACVEDNAPRLSIVQTLSVETRDALGTVSSSRAKIIWRRFSDGHTRLLLRLMAPADVAGAALLVIDRSANRPELWVYFPELGGVRRVISANQIRPLFGQQLPLEELQRGVALFVDKAELRMLEASKVGPRPVWVLEAVPEADAGSPYARIVARIDREYCLPLQLDFFDEDEHLHRRLSIDPGRVKRVAESWVPTKLTLEDLSAGTGSTFTIEEVEVDIPIAPAFLKVRSLEGVAER